MTSATITADIPTYANVDTAFTTREVPWMKMGVQIDKPVTAREAAALGGIDFTVSMQPLSWMKKVEGAPPRYQKIDKRRAIVRDDTDEFLSIVSKSYPIVQFGEAFDFMDTVSPHFVAAGSLCGGRQAFMVVQAPDDVTATPFEDDPHDLYAILRTSHDCSRAVEVAVMPLRNRCMNQLTLRSLTKGVEQRWSVVHAGDVKGKLAAARSTMGMLSEYAKAYVDNAQRLRGIKISDETATSTLKNVLPNRPSREDVIVKIIHNWHSRPETVGYDGTGWGLVQAVSEYFDHDRVGGTPESRFLGALQGQTHNAINKTAARILSRV